MKTSPIPPGFHAVTPYLSVHHVRKTIAFLKDAFNAEELDLRSAPDGRVMNATLRIRDSMVFLGEAKEGGKIWPAMIYMYVEDADAVFAQAVRAGGKVASEIKDQVYGDRAGAVNDPSGNQWWIASRKG